ncbi:unnamed protein product [Urochloa humidicola]
MLKGSSGCAYLRETLVQLGVHFFFPVVTKSVKMAWILQACRRLCLGACRPAECTVVFMLLCLVHGRCFPSGWYVDLKYI